MQAVSPRARVFRWLIGVNQPAARSAVVVSVRIICRQMLARFRPDGWHGRRCGVRVQLEHACAFVHVVGGRDVAVASVQQHPGDGDPRSHPADRQRGEPVAGGADQGGQRRGALIVELVGGDRGFGGLGRACRRPRRGRGLTVSDLCGYS